MVIDWANAGRGPVGADVASTWLVLAAARPPDGGPLAAALTLLGRRVFLARFLAGVDRAEGARRLGAALEVRRRDRNISPEELVAMERVVARHRPAG